MTVQLHILYLLLQHTKTVSGIHIGLLTGILINFVSFLCFYYREGGSNEDSILNAAFSMEAEVPPAQVENDCPVRTQTNPAYENEEDDTQVVYQATVDSLLRVCIFILCQFFPLKVTHQVTMAIVQCIVCLYMLTLDMLHWLLCTALAILSVS